MSLEQPIPFSVFSSKSFKLKLTTHFACLIWNTVGKFLRSPTVLGDSPERKPVMNVDAKLQDFKKVELPVIPDFG